MSEELNNKEVKLYEIGFHLLPNLTEEEANGKFAEITAKVEKAGGVVKLSRNTELKQLSYDIKKSGGGKKDSFSSAYFGSITFEMNPEDVRKVKDSIDKMAEVLRVILIDVPKEVLAPAKERRIPQSHKEETKRTSDPKGDEKPINEEELDKTIEQLVIE